MKKKILDLFDYRYLPKLIDRLDKTAHDREEFINALVQLQWKIYDLDHILESEWNIIETRLDLAWEEINSSLNKLGIKHSEIGNYTKEIHVYQKHELGQRTGDSLLDIDMEDFYYYKSCDVKLIRRIIYEQSPQAFDDVPLDDWKAFDLITEVNDDVEDLYEDLGSNNGNRYMIEILTNNLEKATSKFVDFLDVVIREFETGIGVNHEIVQLTNKTYTETIDLLRNRLEHVKNKENLLRLKSEDLGTVTSK